MGTNAPESELVRQIVEDSLGPAEESRAVERLTKSQPQAALSLLPVFVQQKHDQQEEIRRLTATLQAPPWYPATVIRRLAGTPARALVAAGGRQAVVGLGPGLESETLCGGTPVYLNSQTNVLVALAGDAPAVGDVAAFSRFHQGLAVLRGVTGEEAVVEVAESLRETGLQDGDLVLYDREARVALGRLPGGGPATSIVEEIPDVTLEAVGGCDDLLDELREEMDLHVLHPEVVAAHGVRPNRGVLLCGPPGCGKTLIARALANHLSRLQGITATFLNVRPSAHRSMWYGETEQRVREFFAAARRAASGDGKAAVMFFDDVDHLGSRGDHAAGTVDTRVLPSFLGEIDRLADLPRIWLIAATNRPDLLDEALLRPGRFGDKVFRVPRPGRQAAREILSKHLSPDLPYWGSNGHGPEGVIAEIIEAALARLYAPNGESSTLATLVLRDGSRRPVLATDVLSGALLAQAVAEAKRQSCLRAVQGDRRGISASDLLRAIDRQLAGVTQRLKPGPALRQMLDLGPDLDVVNIEASRRQRLPARHEYLQAPARS